MLFRFFLCMCVFVVGCVCVCVCLQRVLIVLAGSHTLEREVQTRLVRFLTNETSTDIERDEVRRRERGRQLGGGIAEGGVNTEREKERG